MNKKNTQFWANFKTSIERCKPGEKFLVLVPSDVRMPTVRSFVCNKAKPLRKKFITAIRDKTYLEVIRADNGLLSSLDPLTFPLTKPWAEEGIKGYDK